MCGHNPGEYPVRCCYRIFQHSKKVHCIQADSDRYFPHIYGQKELGGTSWLYLSPVPFEELEFPAFKTEPVTELSEAVATYGTAGVAASVTFLLGGLYYWFRRREGTLQLERMADDQEGEVES